MESRHYTGKWRKKCGPCILFLLTVLRQSAATEGQNNSNNSVSCLENEYLHNGVCCDKCPPGYKLTQKCSGEGLRSKCEKCSSGTYQDNMNNYGNCFLCRKKCDSKEVEEKNCTHMQNRECGCQKGYYKNVLNEITMSCEPCKKCGAGERQTISCGGERNTVCECKDYHYRVGRRICAQCTNCSAECSPLCPPDFSVTPSPAIRPVPGLPLHTALIPVVFFLVIAFVVVIGLYEGVRQWRKRRRALYSQSVVSRDPENQVGKSLISTCSQSKEDESNLLSRQPDPVLPDCVPREIKTHEFIYFVLDIVPVNRFKELVRRLNVSEQDIDRAERDNRAFADAQYQMLMVWIGTDTRGGKSVLPRSLLLECVEKLKDMNLNSCADSIEDKYA